MAEPRGQASPRTLGCPHQGGGACCERRVSLPHIEPSIAVDHVHGRQRGGIPSREGLCQGARTRRRLSPCSAPHARSCTAEEGQAQGRQPRPRMGHCPSHPLSRAERYSHSVAQHLGWCGGWAGRAEWVGGGGGRRAAVVRVGGQGGMLGWAVQMGG